MRVAVLDFGDGTFAQKIITAWQADQLPQFEYICIIVDSKDAPARAFANAIAEKEKEKKERKEETKDIDSYYVQRSACESPEQFKDWLLDACNVKKKVGFLIVNPESAEIPENLLEYYRDKIIYYE